MPHGSKCRDARFLNWSFRPALRPSHPPAVFAVQHAVAATRFHLGLANNKGALMILLIILLPSSYDSHFSKSITQQIFSL
jgi:hypothetical protein